MYNRILIDKIKKSPKSILLLGPRQVGKSTLIRELNPQVTINLADENEYFLFQQNNLELESRISAKTIKTVFIDEIQRIPRLMNTIQVIVDNNPKIKFYLTGSSARKLRRGKANLLPGRIFTYQLAPLSFSEFGDDWNEKKNIQFGSLPGVHNCRNEQDMKKLLQSYSNSYLKEEILSESLVRGVDGFVRFLREAAVNSGGFLDYSKLAKKSKVPRQTVVRHYEILEDTLIAKRIENDPEIDLDKCDLIKHPKFFFFDLGVVNALRGSFDLSEDRIGSLWEHFVFNQLTNSAHANDVDLKIHNFRTRGGLEVDFILSLDSKKFAIECKASNFINSSDYQNLIAVDSYYPNIKKIVLYRGKHEKKENGVWILPFDKIFSILGLK